MPVNSAGQEIGVPSVIARYEFLGATMRYRVMVGETEVSVDAPFQSGRQVHAIGTAIRLNLATESLCWMDR